MAQPTPFAAGRNFTLIFLLGTAKVEVINKTFSVEEDAVMANDDVNGEDRTRDQKIVNGYNIKTTNWTEDEKLIVAAMADTAQRDTRAQPQDAGLLILFKPNNGTRKGFVSEEITLGAWALNVSGRTDRAMFDLPMRARYFRPGVVV